MPMVTKSLSLSLCPQPAFPGQELELTLGGGLLHLVYTHVCVYNIHKSIYSTEEITSLGLVFKVFYLGNSPHRQEYPPWKDDFLKNWSSRSALRILWGKSGLYLFGMSYSFFMLFFCMHSVQESVIVIKKNIKWGIRQANECFSYVGFITIF